MLIIRIVEEKILPLLKEIDQVFLGITRRILKIIAIINLPWEQSSSRELLCLKI
ncbi:5579_t:CDS:2 [Entrophospora sp. SA101]|nr:5579_t:CDS:2 [Entrophospora sp. SA101]